MENLKNNGKLIVGGLLIGALVGATVGVLFAPHKGTKTRKNIASNVKNSAKKLKKEMKDDGQYIKNKALKFEHILEDKMSKAATSFKDKANELLHNTVDHEMGKK